MKKILTVLCTLLVIGNCACEDLVPLSWDCKDPEPCYVVGNEIQTGDALYRVPIGNDCWGELRCNEHDEYYCSGYREPEPEQCSTDGKDWNCDGLPNNVRYYYNDPENDCDTTEQGACKYAAKICMNGEMVCEPPVGYGSGVEEVCTPQRVDEDCDGLVDADDPSLVLQGEEWVYLGPEGTVNRGECRAGHRECVNGQEVIVGMVVPSKEVCDPPGDDEDCDGLTDEYEGEPVTKAFALVIDTSGSMLNTTNSLTNAVCDWSADVRFNTSMFAISVFGESWDHSDPNKYRVLTDFVSASVACSVLTNATLIIGGAEMGPQAVLAMHTVGDVGELTWPAGLDKQVALFSDEIPQVSTGLLVSDVMTAIGVDCTANTYSVGIFTEPNLVNAWQPMANYCSGFVDFLYDDEESMRDVLDARFGGNCATVQ